MTLLKDHTEHSVSIEAQHSKVQEKVKDPVQDRWQQASQRCKKGRIKEQDKGSKRQKHKIQGKTLTVQDDKDQR